jgi:2-polyprenyl-6-methoxyphenol hydroxylase-like FAD-dependent oxidoreductase
MTKSDDRVLVVGAGPVGLLAALGLARQGVDVTLIESGSAISQAPRASGYHPPTLGLLDRMGLIEDAREIAYRSEIIHFRFPSTGGIVPMSLAALSGRVAHPYFLHLGQHELAEIVLRHLERLPNFHMRWNTELVAFKDTGRGVRAGVDSADGPQVLEAGWMVGADGARSTVRRLVGLEFEGFTWPDRYVATNIRFDFEKYGFAPSNMIHDGSNWAIVTRLGREPLWRLTFGEDGDLPEENYMSRIPERFASILPGVDPCELVAAAPYRVHERAASSFRVGRVLLAGDAAHALNPIGGMGLTGGVFDAWHLSEALGAVIEGSHGEDVLDAYAAERKRVFVEVAASTAREHKKRVQQTDPAAIARNEEMLRLVARDPELTAIAMRDTFAIEGRSPLELVKEPEKAAPERAMAW